VVAVSWLAAAVALGLTVLGGDAPGRLLGAVAVAMLSAAALFGTVARPRLAVDEHGVAVRGLLGVRRWPWARVHRLRVVHHRRLGRSVAMLELDAVDDDGSERLVVFGSLDLGAHPDEVLAAVQAARGLAG
jgi:Bacterial PH domain